jgi:hypothetical protein
MTVPGWRWVATRHANWSFYWETPFSMGRTIWSRWARFNQTMSAKLPLQLRG